MIVPTLCVGTQSKTLRAPLTRGITRVALAEHESEFIREPVLHPMTMHRLCGQSRMTPLPQFFVQRPAISEPQFPAGP